MENRINCSRDKKSLRVDFELSWQVPFTMIFDDVNNDRQTPGCLKIGDIWAEEDHSNLRYIMEYMPSKVGFPNPPVEADVPEEEKELVKEFTFLHLARRNFVDQFESLMDEVRKTARCTKVVTPWSAYVTKAVRHTGYQAQISATSTRLFRTPEVLIYSGVT